MTFTRQSKASNECEAKITGLEGYFGNVGVACEQYKNYRGVVDCE